MLAALGPPHRLLWAPWPGNSPQDFLFSGPKEASILEKPTKWELAMYILLPAS